MLEEKRAQTYCIAMCLLVIIIDQASKYSILAFLSQGIVVPIIPCFNFVLTFNTGISFGLLTPSSYLGMYVIIGLTILCICALCYMFFKTKDILEKYMCSFIIGGAVGNLLDRILHGAVVDFIDIYYEKWHWPAFNLADSFISIGVIVLIIYNFANNK